MAQESEFDLSLTGRIQVETAMNALLEVGSEEPAARLKQRLAIYEGFSIHPSLPLHVRLNGPVAREDRSEIVEALGVVAQNPGPENDAARILLALMTDGPES